MDGGKEGWRERERQRERERERGRERGIGPEDVVDVIELVRLLLKELVDPLTSRMLEHHISY